MLAVRPRMNKETHGDGYFYGLLLQHLPRRNEDQLLQPWDTAERALLEHRHRGTICIDEHFTSLDLEDVVRPLRTLHDLGGTERKPA